VAWGALVWGSGTAYGALYGAFLTLLLFAVVLLHELGHAVMAQHFGIEVADIVLLPIGGVARLSRMPDKPVQELWVALAGPAVNLFLGLLMVPLLMGGAAWQLLQGEVPAWPAVSSPGVFNLATFLLIVNASLLLFNMLPAFPMDGGRVLRALLAMRWQHRRATQVAVIGGRAFAVLFGALAIYTANVFLGMVAIFVFAGAGSEARHEFQPAPEDAAAWPQASTGSSAPQRDYAVGRSAAARSWGSLQGAAGHAPVLLSNTPAWLAFERLRRSPYAALAVVDDRGDIMGLVTRTGMQSRWAAGVRGPVSLFVEPVGFD
jgi:Zn-dependent protease